MYESGCKHLTQLLMSEACASCSPHPSVSHAQPLVCSVTLEREVTQLTRLDKKADVIHSPYCSTHSNPSERHGVTEYSKSKEPFGGKGKELHA